MTEALHWDELHLGHSLIPASHVNRGEYVRLVMNYPCQFSFMQHMFQLAQECRDSNWKMWLQSEGAIYPSGTPEFSTHIGSMIHHRGIIANLTLRENLLLPFLYHGDQQRLECAADEMVEVARWLEIDSFLDDKAGERTTFTHALVSLARCMLARPAIIVAQEVHIGMPPDHLERFRVVSMQALEQLGSGLLYLTASVDDGSGLEYARTLTIAQDCQNSGQTEGE
jgi:ABC-type transport system involved in cytochrome c biogenesis ATPase subunit